MVLSFKYLAISDNYPLLWVLPIVIMAITLVLDRGETLQISSNLGWFGSEKSGSNPTDGASQDPLVPLEYRMPQGEDTALRVEAIAHGELAPPRTVRHCVFCRAYTPHELRPEGVLCVICALTIQEEELDRD